MNEIKLYECDRCKAIYQTVISECDCQVGLPFIYNELFAYKKIQNQHLDGKYWLTHWQGLPNTTSIEDQTMSK